MYGQYSIYFDFKDEDLIFEKGKDKKDKKKQKQSKTDKGTNRQEHEWKNQPRTKPDQPDTERKKSKTTNLKVKGLKVTSSQSLKGLFEVLKSKGPKLPRVEKRFIKEEKEEENTKDRVLPL
ncbi:hypothetical protein Tco_0888957 [Tanacetum coccineum]